MTMVRRAANLAQSKGIVLIATVILIAFASVAVLGVTAFVVQRFGQYNADQINTRCVYLAQAGVQNAVYSYRFRDLTANGRFSLGQTNIDSNNFFVLGATAADLLMVNTSASVLAPATGQINQRYRNLRGLDIQNATNSKTITIDRMVISWNNTRRLQGISIGGSNVWTGNASSPTDVNITNFTLNTVPRIYPINTIRFNGNMTGATITIQFIMSDGSSGKTITVFPASSNYNFIVKATGKTTSAGIYRTIQAEYNALTGRIINYSEISNEITP